MAEKGVKAALKLEAAFSDGFLAVSTGFVGSAWHARAAVPGLRRGGVEIAGISIPGSTRKLPSVLRCQDRQAEIGVTYSIPHRQAAGSLVRHDDIDCLINIGTAPRDIGHLYTDTGLSADRANLCEFTMFEGKHIVTSPGIDADEARLIADCAARYPGQLCILGMEMRFLDSVAALRSLLHQGALGELRGMRGCARSPMALQFASADQTWWHSRRAGGGAIAALAPQFVDLVTFVTGDKVLRVRSSATERLADEKTTEDSITGHRVTTKVTTEDRALLTLEMGRDGRAPWPCELLVDTVDEVLTGGGLHYSIVFEGSEYTHNPHHNMIPKFVSDRFLVVAQLRAPPLCGVSMMMY